MTIDAATRDAMLAAVPGLRAFAQSLCRHRDRADDLVQETLLRAIAHIDSFEPGTNMAAWLFTILRNIFRTDCRKRKWTVEDVNGVFSAGLSVPPEQSGWSIYRDLRDALAKLSVDHREALILVGASGMSYEDAAAICRCEVGTMKSRVNRARIMLAHLMSGEPPRARPPGSAFPERRVA